MAALANPAWSSPRACHCTSMASWGTRDFAATTTSTGWARGPELARLVSMLTNSVRPNCRALRRKARRSASNASLVAGADRAASPRWFIKAWTSPAAASKAAWTDSGSSIDQPSISHHGQRIKALPRMEAGPHGEFAVRGPRRTGPLYLPGHADLRRQDAMAG